MGLDTTHDCWHGPYSMFMRWREWLAARVGLPLQLMEGFADSIWDDSDVEKLDLCNDMRPVIRSLAILGRPIQWSEMNGSPIAKLLHHSDCDGKIVWWECKDLALALLHVYRDSAEHDVLGHGGMDCRRGCYDSMRRATIRFAAGCLRAWRAKEHVVFR
jgi:hypothetical protein